MIYQESKTRKVSSSHLFCVCMNIPLLNIFSSGIRTRAAVTGALFKKSVGLHLQTIGDLSVGKIMSLSANDVRRFDDVSIIITCPKYYI